MISLGLLLVTLTLGATVLNSILVKADEIGPGSDLQVSNLGATEGSVSEPKHVKTYKIFPS
jgi:hypothetical protein